MKKTSRYMSMGVSLGLCFGVAIGCAFGQSLFDNMGTGMCFGTGIGMCLGLAIGAAKDKAVNQQLEEQGYSIKTIQPTQDEKDYFVTIVNNKGEEQTITVSKGELEAETLAAGDYVYLDKEGGLEKVHFDDEE